MTIAQLYKITYLPTKLTYYGSVWAKDKTIYDRLQEHITHRGAKFISKMIMDGANVDDFVTELLCVGEVKYVCDLEAKLSATNLWPKGLNGNAGKNIVRTKEGQKKVSDAVSAAKRGQTKETSIGVALQANKASLQCGDNRTEKQKAWDEQKSQFNKDIKKVPPKVEIGSRIVNNGKINKRVSSSKINEFIDNGWQFGMLGDFVRSEEQKENLRKPKRKAICPHCQLEGGSNSMTRWHFDNCKFK